LITYKLRTIEAEKVSISSFSWKFTVIKKDVVKVIFRRVTSAANRYAVLNRDHNFDSEKESWAVLWKFLDNIFCEPNCFQNYQIWFWADLYCYTNL